MTKSKEGLLLSDEMGSEIVTVYVGKEKKLFNVHKKLICASGSFFDKYFNVDLKSDQVRFLHNIEPVVFKLFLDYLYQKRVPAVQPEMVPDIQAKRVKELCQLYAFSDKFDLHSDISNKIMDCIQDGFFILERLPEAGLIHEIYAHTAPNSKLRTFCGASLVFHLRGHRYEEDGTLGALLNGNDYILDDFLSSVRALPGPDCDPRLRDCQNDPRCVECDGQDRRLGGKQGFWPCYFHIHGLCDGEPTKLIADTKASRGGRLGEDQVCYMWKSE